MLLTDWKQSNKTTLSENDDVHSHWAPYQWQYKRMWLGNIKHMTYRYATLFGSHQFFYCFDNSECFWFITTMRKVEKWVDTSSTHLLCFPEIITPQTFLQKLTAFWALVQNYPGICRTQSDFTFSMIEKQKLNADNKNIGTKTLRSNQWVRKFVIR